MTNTSDRNNLDHADVRIPPPLIYVAGLALGFLLDRKFPVLVLPRDGSAVRRGMGSFNRVEHRFIS